MWLRGILVPWNDCTLPVCHTFHDTVPNLQLSNLHNILCRTDECLRFAAPLTVLPLDSVALSFKYRLLSENISYTNQKSATQWHSRNTTKLAAELQDNRGSVPERGEILFHYQHPHMGPTQFSIQRVSWHCFVCSKTAGAWGWILTSISCRG